MAITDEVLAPLLRADRHLPRLVTYHDLGRTELSTASLHNATAKVAGLLTDELGLVAGDAALLGVGAGWQSVPILLGCWWAGLTVHTAPSTECAVAFLPEGDESAAAQALSADEAYIVSGHPLGAPASSVPAGCEDFSTAIRGQADDFCSSAASDPDRPALVTEAGTMTEHAVLEQGRRAAALFRPGARVLSAARWTWPSPGVELVLGPLLAGGCLIALLDSADAEDGSPAGGEQLDAIAVAERADVRYPRATTR